MQKETTSGVVEDFDASQGWEDVDDAIDYCSRQPNPNEAVGLIVSANLLANERGWCIEFLRHIPESWPKQPALHVLQVTVDYLADLNASWEHPGYVGINYKGFNFAFGTANGPVGYDFSLPDDEDGVRRGGLAEVSSTLSCARIADFIRHEVRRVVDNYTEEYMAFPAMIFVRVIGGHDVATTDRIHKAFKSGADSDLKLRLADDFNVPRLTIAKGQELPTSISDTCKKLKKQSHAR